MATITFTSQLERYLDAPSQEVQETTLGAALELVMQANQRLRGYVFNDQGQVRKHVALFVDGLLITGPETLNHPLGAKSEVHVMQALSGG